MLRASSSLLFPFGALALASACADGSDGDGPAAAGGLALADGTGGAAAGVAGTASFRVVTAAGGALDIEIQLEESGIVLTFVVDRARGVAEADGYLRDTGEDAALTAADRAQLRRLARALDLLGPDVEPEIALTRDLASLWSEFPAGEEMQHGIVLAESASGASACAYLYRYVRGTHDGWWESNWADKTTLEGAYLSMHGPCRSPTDEDTQSTWWRADTWHCLSNEPSHSTSIEYAYGDCLGRCGSGCGTGTVFTWGCLDHDVCNRFGHSWSASLPGGNCGDEFTAAASQLLSEPECR